MRRLYNSERMVLDCLKDSSKSMGEIERYFYIEGNSSIKGKEVYRLVWSMVEKGYIRCNDEFAFELNSYAPPIITN